MASEDALRRFGEAARAERERLKFSLQSVSAALEPHGVKVSHQAVGSWERAESEPSREKVFALEKVLRLQPGALSAYLGYGPLIDDEDADDFNSQIARLQPDDQRRVADLIRRLQAGEQK